MKHRELRFQRGALSSDRGAAPDGLTAEQRAILFGRAAGLSSRRELESVAAAMREGRFPQ